MDIIPLGLLSDMEGKQLVNSILKWNVKLRGTR